MIAFKAVFYVVLAKPFRHKDHFAFVFRRNPHHRVVAAPGNIGVLRAQRQRRLASATGVRAHARHRHVV